MWEEPMPIPIGRKPFSSLRWLWQRGCLTGRLWCGPLLPVRRPSPSRKARPAGARPTVETLEDRRAAADTVGSGLALGALGTAVDLAAMPALIQVEDAPGHGPSTPRPPKTQGHCSAAR